MLSTTAEASAGSADAQASPATPAVVYLKDSRHVTIRDSRLRGKAKVFVRIEGGTKQVALVGNDLGGVQEFDLGKGAAADFRLETGPAPR